MKNVAIIFDSVYGQTGKIASHLSSELQRLGISSRMIKASDSRSGMAPNFQNEKFDAVIIGTPVYASKFLSSVLKLVRQNQEYIQSKPLALFTVSLNAADRHETARAADLNLLQKLMDVTGVRPQYLASFSGSLMYSEYNWLLRIFLKRIARKAGGDTDTTRNYEYTNWPQVNAFLQAFVEDNRQSEFAINRKMNPKLLSSNSRTGVSLSSEAEVLP